MKSTGTARTTAKIAYLANSTLFKVIYNKGFTPTHGWRVQEIGKGLISNIAGCELRVMEYIPE